MTVELMSDWFIYVLLLLKILKLLFVGTSAPDIPVAFFNSLTVFKALNRIILYNTATNRIGKIPNIVDNNISCGGAIKTYQQYFPLPVSPRHPIAGKNPTIAPKKHQLNI